MLNGYASFTATRDVTHVVVALRAQIDAILQRKIEQPSLDIDAAGEGLVAGVALHYIHRNRYRYFIVYILCICMYIYIYVDKRVAGEGLVAGVLLQAWLYIIYIEIAQIVC